MNYPELLADIPRGVEDADGEVRLDEQRLPLAVFARPERVAGDPRLRFDGKRIFLGVIEGSTELRQSGDINEPHVLGGVPVGIANDMHMLTAAGVAPERGVRASCPRS